MEILIGVLIGAAGTFLAMASFLLRGGEKEEVEDVNFSSLLVKAIDNSKVSLEEVFNFMDVDCINNVHLDEHRCELDGDVIKFVFSVEIDKDEYKEFTLIYSKDVKDFVKWGFVCGEETL
jgi:hypothetical protein